MIINYISVVICTYKRPILLEKCIVSVLNQRFESNFEIIVVDNDFEESARAIVDNFNSRIRYFIQPIKGLSNARNLAVSEAVGDFILFIDDDEYADENWLSKMVECQCIFQADVVLGKVVYEIPERFPLYIRQSSYFTRKSRRTGDKALFNEGYTGNTLVRKVLFNLRTPAFLASFNHTGGEDSEFFNFLLKKKMNILFSNDAIIYETQDDQRLKVSWFYKRGYRTGYNYSSFLFDNYSVRIAFIKLLLSVLGGLILSLILSLITLFRPYKYFLKTLAKLANQFGKVGYLFGYQIKDYVS